MVESLYPSWTYERIVELSTPHSAPESVADALDSLDGNRRATAETKNTPTSAIEVRQHRGRSGKSVYEWRVYRRFGIGNSHRRQLGKYRTQEAAERAAEHFRRNDERVAAKWAALKARSSS